MFLKIVSSENEEVYECAKTSVHTDETFCYIKIIDKNGKVEEVEVDKADSDVYFMNDEGKTIDRLVWR